ncbi:ATP-dependent DNA helicase [Fusarium keratoplasticum]|uniref:ATP-dependent DNA helicase n=1 Tax=Fusarium keratoplasticum TaxID=1328300 RepID=A0ACC0RAF7_9HYPO|nr:ATP-dependent DNA helicase [Fusarium keratoplasticum]KAI8676065.1 ATP-dependent DNA helicase [Fusarium keratoplasticum]
MCRCRSFNAWNTTSRPPGKKARTAQIVSPAERGMDDENAPDIDEVIATLRRGQQGGVEHQPQEASRGDEALLGDGDANPKRPEAAVHEISSSGMFALDAHPDVADIDKLRFVWEAVGEEEEEQEVTEAAREQRKRRTWAGSAALRQGSGLEPYISVSRGEDFSDSSDPCFFAKTFPTLIPFGCGGPRLAEESIAISDDRRGTGVDEGAVAGAATAAEVAARSLLSSRNMSLATWAEVVLRRHGGRFATHHVFAFLVFNLGVRSRNRRVSMLSVSRKEFPAVERIVRSLSRERLELAQRELELSDQTADEGIKELLRSISLYGFRQPMSREHRLSLRRKIKSLIIRYGIPAIWFTLNPNDITNPVKLRLAAYRTHDPEGAEAFLRSLDMTYKRARLAISDPVSSAIFFHREISLFFEHYVKVGEESVFGQISQCFGAVEANERGALHVHGLLWLHGNMQLSSVLADVRGEEGASYGDRIVELKLTFFDTDTQDLDQESFCAVRAERSVTADISPLLQDSQQFVAAFDEEANFCAGATQIHTHSPTCVKYSLGRPEGKRDLCRFKAPWKLVEKTGFDADGVLQIRRTHSMVNRWNKAIAVGLRHNHDISFIATQCMTMALVYYLTNYATKVEDPMWKRVAAAAEVLGSLDGGEPRQDCVAAAAATATATARDVSDRDGIGQNKTRQFLMKVANRVFTERPLSQVEVAAHLLGYETEFSNSAVWTFLNVSVLYWHIFRRWHHLRCASGAEALDQPTDDSVLVEQTGRRISFFEAYHHRGEALRDLCLYDYVSLVKLKRKSSGRRGGAATWGEVPFQGGTPFADTWVQVLRRPGEHAVVCLDGYLSMDFSQDDDDDGRGHERAAVQHLALFVPWECFLSESGGDIGEIWVRHKETLSRRVSSILDNIQLLRRSAEDAQRDARQWAASSGEEDHVAGETGSGGAVEGDDEAQSAYRSDDIGDATRLIDVVRNAAGANQITGDSKELSAMMQQLCRFQHAALGSTSELRARIAVESEGRMVTWPAGPFTGAEVPAQRLLKSIKSQQTSASRETEKTIQGIQGLTERNATSRSAAVDGVLSGFGEQDVQLTAADPEESTLARPDPAW